MQFIFQRTRGSSHPYFTRRIGPQEATDNNTYQKLHIRRISEKMLRQRKSRSIDVRFHWFRNRVRQGIFIVYWGPGTDNKVDYYTKHQPAAHYCLVRYNYLQPTPDGSKYTHGLVPRDPRRFINLALYLGTRVGHYRATSQSDPGTNIQSLGNKTRSAQGVINLNTG